MSTESQVAEAGATAPGRFSLPLLQAAEAAGTTVDGKPAAEAKKPAVKAAPTDPRNRLGLLVSDYKAGESTLCAGCGHDAISMHIIRACHELGVNQYDVAKLSGIGCSSKTPAYFLGKSHGFNSVHGRMPSIATGVHLANRNLRLLAVSGDGDTASIGLGQYSHIIRRNVPLVYIVENNGVYGLTKGQFSATADKGAPNKRGVLNEFDAIDLCSLAMTLGATFVARSFSGDVQQVKALVKAALSHQGTAILDIISPCVTFNNHEGSKKSLKTARDSEVPIQDLQFVPFFEQITVDYAEGTTKDVVLHDGSKIVLKKLERDYDPTDRRKAVDLLEECRTDGSFLTGLIYIDTTKSSLGDVMELPPVALSALPPSHLRPGKDVLDKIMNGLR